MTFRYRIERFCGRSSPHVARATSIADRRSFKSLAAESHGDGQISPRVSSCTERLVEEAEGKGPMRSSHSASTPLISAHRTEIALRHGRTSTRLERHGHAHTGLVAPLPNFLVFSAEDHRRRGRAPCLGERLRSWRALLREPPRQDAVSFRDRSSTVRRPWRRTPSLPRRVPGPPGGCGPLPYVIPLPARSTASTAPASSTERQPSPDRCRPRRVADGVAPIPDPRAVVTACSAVPPAPAAAPKASLRRCVERGPAPPHSKPLVLSGWPVCRATRARSPRG